MHSIHVMEQFARVEENKIMVYTSVGRCVHISICRHLVKWCECTHFLITKGMRVDGAGLWPWLMGRSHLSGGESRWHPRREEGQG